MAKVDIWMPVYIGDYLRDTEELSAEEHGAYLLLLMHYWQKSGEIGSDIDRLARVARTDAETARFILGYYFVLVDGSYKNKRADEEIRNAESRRSSATENGKKGGRPPKNNPQITDGLAKRNPQESSSSSSSSSSSQSPSTSKKDKSEYPDIFLTFWESYPKKDGKKMSIRTWNAELKRGTKPEDILYCLDRYKTYLKNNNVADQYTKNPATFINNFEDWRTRNVDPPESEHDRVWREAIEEVDKKRAEERAREAANE